jgi:hypothetical protein
LAGSTDLEKAWILVVSSLPITRQARRSLIWKA